MQIERQQAATKQSTSKPDPTTPVNKDDTGARATHLAQSAETLIDRILSEDSRSFLDANRQTGGQ